MTTLMAEATIPTRAGEDYIAAVCARLARSEMATEQDLRFGRVTLGDGLGIGTMEAEADRLKVRIEASTEQGLSVLKFLLSLHIEHVASDEKPDVVWTGDGCSLDVLPSLREMTVLRVTDITPHVRRITFTGRDLKRFDSDSLHVRLLFPPDGVSPPEWPRPGANGRPVWPPEDRRPVQRIYTIRRIDVAAAEMDIDFVMHAAAGVASGWAANARAGDLIGLMGPGGREIRQTAFVLLAGDETAIPAMARIMERLSPEVVGEAFIEVEDEREVQHLAHPEGLAVTWLFRRGLEPGRNDLLANAITSVRWPEHDDVTAWLGAEDAIARRIRKHWRDEKGLDRTRTLAVGYWTHELSRGAPAEAE